MGRDRRAAGEDPRKTISPFPGCRGVQVCPVGGVGILDDPREVAERGNHGGDLVAPSPAAPPSTGAVSRLPGCPQGAPRRECR